MRCDAPIGFETLIEYWLGEVQQGSEAALEEHLFGCASCTKRLEGLVALASGVRATVAEGRVSLAVSVRFVETMRQAGLRLREYRVEPGGSVNCTIQADDDAVISRIRAPLSGVKRIDVVRSMGGGVPDARVADVPFDPETGEVLIIPSPAWLKTMPAFTTRMRLIAMGERGEAGGADEKALGDYTFNHAPS
jgi:hypothetical protein